MSRFATFGDLKDRVEDGLKDHTEGFFSRATIGDAVNEGQWNMYMLLHGINVGLFFDPTPTTLTIDSTSDTWDIGKAIGSVDEIIPVADVDKYRKFIWCSRHADQFREMRSLPANQLYDASAFMFDVVGNTQVIIVPRPLTAFDINIYTMDEPVEMISDSDSPTLKLIFRQWIIQYAVRKLKGDEESGEYYSHDQLISFLTQNINNYVGRRGGTNNGTVTEFEG
jgi:hypothetical protein